MKTISGREFFRGGDHKAGPQKIKTIEDIERENAKLFGKKRRKKASFDGLQVLRDLRQ